MLFSLHINTKIINNNKIYKCLLSVLISHILWYNDYQLSYYVWTLDIIIEDIHIPIHIFIFIYKLQK